MTSDGGRSGAMFRREAKRKLELIAEHLGCPVEAFDGNHAAMSECAALTELLHLWHSIAEPSKRRHILEFARREAERNGVRDGAAKT